MFKIFKCRRSSLALIATGLLTFLGVHNGVDTSMAIATIIGSVAAANSFENSKKGKE